MAVKNVEVVEIKPMELVTVKVRVRGDSPLIMHCWSEKAMKMILDTQMGVAKKKGHEVKSPVEDFIDSMYWLEGKPADKTEEGFMKAVGAGARWGFPVTAFKQATIASAYRSGVTKDMASLRGVFFIKGEGTDQCVEIKGCVPTMREDMVRVGNGAADIRFRGQFNNWYADLEVSFDVNGKYSLDQIVNLINRGGFACGVGEWRPEKDGSYGMYHVEATDK